MQENKRLFSIPSDIWKMIFTQASENGTDPGVLEQVCKYWYSAMRYDSPKGGPRIKDAAGIPYTTKSGDVFMEDCMRRYRESISSRFRLIYKPEYPKYISIPKDGKADLSDCGDEEERQVYTRNLERFFKIEGRNKDKLVTFIGASHTVQDLTAQGLSTAVSATADMVILWRYGNWKDKRNFDLYEARGVDDLPALDNMYAIWLEGARMADPQGLENKRARAWPAGQNTAGSVFQCFFVDTVAK